MRMLRFTDGRWRRSRSPLDRRRRQAQTKITVGKITSGSGFHIPSYVAMEQGFYKAEGLDASFITLGGRALVTAGLTGSIDFIPIPSGGAQAALSGAPIRYVVGELLKSHWLIISRPDIAKPEDLRGKTLGLWPRRLRRLRRGRRRDAARVQDGGRQGLQGDLVPGRKRARRRRCSTATSTPSWSRCRTRRKALSGGMKVLVRVSDYIQRAGGSFWTRKEFVDQHPDTVKKFIRAIASGVMFYRDNKAGSLRLAQGAPRHRQRQGRRHHLGGNPQHVRRRASAREIPRDLRVAPTGHDCRQAMGAGQAAARPGAVPDARRCSTRRSRT